MKAVLKNGAILPKEPLPEDWDDGTELQVEKLPSDGTNNTDDLDRWMAAVQVSADEMDPEDEMILEKTIRDIRAQARDLALKVAEKP